jgi:glycerol-3-phosphate acyltransferase PlsY
VFAMIAPVALGLAVVVFAIVILATGYVSLGSIVASVALLAATVFANPPRAILVVAGAAAALIIVRHAENIRRMRAGTEPRIF